ncbi:unnamed protein product [Polarella glacialis]|uniref:Uncharacterized protein n=1 Tax=Polarella glacialis TaxID=89957 RepID=A0A813KP37_POLGL|nr:unnamed protein product [Polarella glacialis]|mmetsp:Transcript_10877/g.17346  ORF Transcript_10877/g.17346 Transcript_10877/m.17346 type:complete len:179 (+) Transcript_10877:146-682(+)
MGNIVGMLEGEQLPPWTDGIGAHLRVAITDMSERLDYPRMEPKNEVDAILQMFVRKVYVEGLPMDWIAASGAAVPCTAKISKNLSTLSVTLDETCESKDIRFGDCKQLRIDGFSEQTGPRVSDVFRLQFRAAADGKAVPDVRIRFKDRVAAAICNQLIPVLMDCNNGWQCGDYNKQLC